MENNVDLAERFGRMWRQAREDGGRSQEYMAKALGVSKKTVQNWEEGTSAPNQIKGFLWFQALGLQALPYYLRLMYPEQFDRPDLMGSDEDVEKALCVYIHGCPPEMKRELLYLLLGEHGSSPIAVLELMNAHLHSPLRNRLNVAETVRTNYEVAEKMGELVHPEQAPANIKQLDWAIESAKEAVIRADYGYSRIIRGDEEE